MSLEADIFSTLGSLVSNRVYPLSFIQPNGALPVWPAIRYEFISVIPYPTQCGDGGDATADTRVQIDYAATTFMAMRAGRLQIMAAMEPFYPPVRFQDSFERKDEVTKTYHVSLDYIVYRSSIAGSP